MDCVLPTALISAADLSGAFAAGFLAAATAVLTVIPLRMILRWFFSSMRV